MIDPYTAAGTFAGTVKRMTRWRKSPGTIEERKQFFKRDYWVDYPRAMELLNRFEDMYAMEGQVRPEGMLVTGPPNNGKTSTAFKFMRDRLVGYQKVAGRPDAPPIVKAETPPGAPSPRSLYMALLQEVGAPYNPRSAEQVLYNQVIQLFTESGVRMLILDEIHNGLAGGPNQQRIMLNTLKSLSNTLQISIVMIGTDDARVMFERDDQIKSRFPAFEMPAWEFSEEYAQLVDDMFGAMELDIPSLASDYDFVDELHQLSGGLMGKTKQLVAQFASQSLEASQVVGSARKI